MKNPEIAVVTGTFYPQWSLEVGENLHPDKLRGDLTVSTIEAAKSNGFLISVVDGGSSSSFTNELDKLNTDGNVLWQKEQIETPEERKIRGGGQGLARRQGLEIVKDVPGIKVVMQTEPEKVSMVADCLSVAAQPILNGEADIVIPRRTDESFNSYPPFQAAQEQRSNTIYNRILRSRGLLKEEEPDLDLWFGPKVFANSPDITTLFEKVYRFEPANSALEKKIRPDAYSNPLIYPVVEALMQGKRVKSVTVDYRHPAAQTKLEDGNVEFDARRKTQQRIIVTELVHFIKMKEGKPNRLLV